MVCYERFTTVDVADRILLPDGEVRFLDSRGQQLFHDKTPVSGCGADEVRDLLRKALLQ